MVEAPVGFQCRECAGQGARSSPVFTAADVQRRADAVPYVSYTLIGICVGIFLAEFVTGVDDQIYKYGMQPVLIALQGEYYRLVTSAFLHGSIIHLGFNMFVLFMIGPTLERVMGPVRFLALYALAGLGGQVASYMFSSPSTFSVGASGAIFGLFGALVVAGRRLRADVSQILVLLAVNLAIGFLPGGSIDWRAHLGGLVVGALAALVLTHAPSNSFAPLLQIVGCVAIAGILFGAIGWRSTELRNQFDPHLLSPGTASALQSGTAINDQSPIRTLGDVNE